MDAATIVSTIYTLAKAVYEAHVTVKVNKRQCARFVERVTLVQAQLDAFDVSGAQLDKSKQRHVQLALQQLHDAIVSGLQLIEEFSSKSYFKRFIGYASDESAFDGVHRAMIDAISVLSFGMQIADWEATDAGDERDDARELMTLLPQMLADMQAQSEQLSKVAEQQNVHFANQAEYMETLQRRLASQRAQMRMVVEMLGEKNSATAAAAPRNVDADAKRQQQQQQQKHAEHDRFFIPFHTLELKEELGRGGFGIVYRAYSPLHGEDVAAKVLNVTPGSGSIDHLRDSFRNEIELMKSVRGAVHVVPFLGMCLDEKNCCILTKLAKYSSVWDVLHPRTSTSAAAALHAQLTWDLKWLWAFQMVKGVSELHRAHVVHQDIKSLNFLVDQEYDVQLCDFGLARVRASSKGSTNGGGDGGGAGSDGNKVAVGTYLWMAPELFRGKKSTPASDVFALAIVFWELVSGDVPWTGQDMDFVKSLLRDGERPEMPDHAPKHFRSLIEWCWAQEPSNRPSCVDIVAKMREWHAAPLSRSAHELVNTTSTSPSGANHLFVRVSSNVPSPSKSAVPLSLSHAATIASTQQPLSASSLSSPTKVPSPEDARIAALVAQLRSSNDMKNIAEAMRTSEANAEVVRAACERVSALTHKFVADAKSARDSASRHGVIELILQVLRKHASNTSAIEQASHAIACLCSDNRDNVGTVTGAGGADLLMYVLKYHRSDSRVVVHICGALTAIATDATNRAKFKDAGGGTLLAIVMEQHMSDARVVEHACHTLADMKSTDSVKADAQISIKALITVMEQHSLNVDAMVQACRALACHDLAELVGQAGGIDTVLRVLRLHTTNAELVREACRVLSSLNDSVAENRVRTANAGGALALAQALKLHMLDADLCDWLCLTVARIALNSNVAKRACGSTGIVELLLQAAKHHATDAEPMKHDVAALCNVIYDVVENQARLMAAGGLDSMLQVIKRREPSVCAFLMSALFGALASNNQAKVAEAGGIVEMLNVLQLSTSDAQTIQFALLALGRIADNNAVNQAAIADAGGIDIMLEVVEREPAQEKNVRIALFHIGIERLFRLAREHLSDLVVVKRVCTAISEVDEDSHRNAVIQAGGLEALQEMMVRHGSDARVATCSILAIGKIAKNASYSVKIGESRCIPTVVKLMRLHLSNSTVAGIACFALTSLASDNAANVDTIIGAGGAVELVRAMQLHAFNEYVVTRAADALGQCAHFAVPRRKILGAGGIEALLQMMRQNGSNRAIIVDVCIALRWLESDSKCRTRIIKSGGLPLAQAAAKAFPDVSAAKNLVGDLTRQVDADGCCSLQ